MNTNIEILELIKNNPKLSVENIATMLDKSEDEIKDRIEKMEKDKTIIGYNTIINWENCEKDIFTAVIEVKVIPKKNVGFSAIVDEICKFEEVKSCYLMTGGFDLLVVLQGKSMKDVSLFIAEKIALIDGVTDIDTHFVLKQYKVEGIDCSKKDKDGREVVVL